MKKFRILPILICILMLAGCGRKSMSDIVIDSKGLCDRLATEVTYETNLQEVSADTILNYITVEFGVDSYMYMSDSGMAEEVAVFACNDEDTADAMESNIKTFLDNQEKSFENYLPAEAKKVSKALVERRGDYVILYVGSERSKARAVIDSAFNQ